MDILILAPGNSIHSKRWIDAFKNRFSVLWVSLHSFEYETSAAKQIQYTGNPILLIISGLKILFLALRYKIDLVHIHSIARYGLAAIFLCLFSKKKLILSPWGSDLIYGKNNFFWYLVIKYLIRRSDKIIVDAEHMKNLCISIDEQCEAKIEKIMFGIDIDFFKNSIRKESREISFNILSVRNHEDIYNIDKIIEAFSVIYRELDNCKLTIMGYGSNTNSLKQQAQDLSLRNNISFTGKLDRDGMLDIINQSDIIISASNSDAGLSSSIGEAMSCEKIVLASAEGGENHLWIEENETGYLFDHNSVDSLVSTMKKANKNRSRFENMGKKARRIILEKNNSKIEMSRVEKIYTQFI